jgi:hypothetical protein
LDCDRAFDRTGDPLIDRGETSLGTPG